MAEVTGAWHHYSYSPRDKGQDWGPRDSYTGWAMGPLFGLFFWTSVSPAVEYEKLVCAYSFICEDQWFG